MSDTQGLPVKGYRPTQSSANIDLVNENKVLEEMALRQIDRLKGMGSALDQRSVAEAMTCIQTGFMWLNRAVFQPGRVELPSDKAGE